MEFIMEKEKKYVATWAAEKVRDQTEMFTVFCEAFSNFPSVTQSVFLSV